MPRRSAAASSLARALALRPALAAALALCVMAGCSRHSREAGPAAPASDTLLVRITPALSNWLELWRYADPEIAVDSLERASEAPFTLRDIRGYPAFAIGVRGRLQRLGVWAPDSMRVVEPDTAVMVSDAGFLMHVADGSPATAALVDLKINSIATLDTCSGELDGAFWDGNERFGLTGTLPPDSTGLRRAFVRYFDLGAGTVTEFRTRGVAEDAWRHYLVARETARAARLRASSP